MYDREIVDKAVQKPDDYTGLDVFFADQKTKHTRLLERSNQDIVQPDT